MKIKYTFSNGDTNHVEVTEELGEQLLNLDRLERNNNQTETRRHSSLEAFNLDDSLLPSSIDIPTDLLKKIDLNNLHKAIDMLLPDQQMLIRRIFFEDTNLVDIAREESVSKSAISHRLDRALKKLKKYL